MTESTRITPAGMARTAALALSLLAGTALAGSRVDVLVFTQPGASADQLAWSTTRPLPPCHAVQLHEGGGAEAAFANESECARKAGYDPAYAGYAAAGPSTLAVPASRLKNGGYGVVVNRGWRQANGNQSPVMLRGGRVIAGHPEVEGTLEYTAAEKYFEVTLNLVLTRLGADGKTPEYLVVNETRKMKSGEPHYFDHPLLGAVVQVTDTTPQDAKPAAAAAP